MSWSVWMKWFETAEGRKLFLKIWLQDVMIGIDDHVETEYHSHFYSQKINKNSWEITEIHLIIAVEYY